MFAEFRFKLRENGYLKVKTWFRRKKWYGYINLWEANDVKQSIELADKENEQRTLSVCICYN